MSEAKMERQALEWLLKTVEAMRCPQTVADVALLMLKFKGPVEFARKVLVSPSPAPVAAQSDKRTAIWELRKAVIGSCGCETKTPDIAYHNELCRYRILQSAINILESSVAAADQGIKEEPSEQTAARSNLNYWHQEYGCRIRDMAAVLHETEIWVLHVTATESGDTYEKANATLQRVRSVLRRGYQDTVSKEVSRSDEEIAKGYAAKFMRDWYQDGREEWLVPFIKDAIRRAKEVSESADTARLDAVLSELIESSGLITVWTGTDPLKEERFLNARNKAIAAMSAKG